MKRPTPPPYRYLYALSGLFSSLSADLCNVIADGDPPGLHVLRDTPLQTDLQQTILEGGTSHLDVVREVEAAFERPC